MNKKSFWFAALAVLLSSITFSAFSWIAKSLSATKLQLDLNSPDVLIRTNSLAKLPADIMRVPLLHDLLKEEFLFIYEHNEGRLGFEGAIRRIAYEHSLEFSDRLVRLVLDEPADVALWRARDGSLQHYVIAMNRGKLAKLLEPAAKIALKDKQLTLVGEIPVANATAQLFSLDFSSKRKLLFVSHADRVVVLSDPGMLLTKKGLPDPKGVETVQALLSNDKGKQQRYAQAFQLEANTLSHSIAVKSHFLSFGYQHFFPNLKALRFDFGRDRWATQVFLDGASSQHDGSMNGRALWESVPHLPSSCALLPVNWTALSSAVTGDSMNASLQKLSKRFVGPAAVCWYARSRLHTPLFAAVMADNESTATTDEMISQLFDYSIKSKEQKTKFVRNKDGDSIWQPDRGSSGEINESDKKTVTKPTLARSGKRVFFSPDGALVTQALAVAHKRQPALADGWKESGAKSDTIAVIGTTQLSKLLVAETELSLPQNQEAALRAVADKHLMPRLASLKKYPPMRLTLGVAPSGPGWVPVDWQTY